MSKTLILEGSRIHDIGSFYDQINGLFMADESWQLGPSLDALNDLLYGGFGVLQGNEPLTLIWRDIAQSRAALGRDATRRYYQDKLAQPQRYHQARIRQELALLERGEGPTYFDIILEIIADHPNITLVPA
ncbi:barstar family protein [Enterobacteriaceae bacterium BIT-l23]|uniref:Ribonuclease inhibitor n=1 Tax=Jejubacter calystegiae TaxID=2579935 RepID=A0A4P8YJ92_9ENTR|nr:barstar family protein [Jejubacter calystegiae]NUU66796.1 barstar family protein [Enterobacteriaceae bacterium BIT-l23]QCT18442.1 ribonuclease inhibitor [Jejubacter calystegiae]